MNRLCAVLLVVACFAADVASAGKISVPGDYDSVQAAIDAAGPGDTISVRAGSYPGIVTIDGKTGLWIQGKKAVVSGFTVLGSEDIRIEGFVIAGSTEAAAIDVGTSQGVTICKCSILDSDGDGIRADHAEGLVIEKCLLHGIGACGLRLRGSSHGAVIRSNRLTDIVEHGIGIDDSADCLVEANSFVGCAGCGILVEGSSTRTVVRKNAVAGGYCGFISDGGDGNRFEANKATGVEHGYVLASGTGNTFSKNAATDVDIGFEIAPSVDPEPLTEAHEASVPIDAIDSTDVSVGSSGRSMTFRNESVSMPQYQGKGVLVEVKLAVATDIAMTSLVQNLTSAHTSTYWYGRTDAVVGALHIDADYAHHRNYDPMQVGDEAWDYDVVSEGALSNDLEEFVGIASIQVSLLGFTNLCSYWNPVFHDETTWDGAIELSLTYSYVHYAVNLFGGNKVSGATEHGFVVAAHGVTLEKNQAKSCGACGFRAETSGNKFTGNKACGSGSFDMEDTAGGNLYVGNKFPAASIP
jgi:parallel beta-helix repeat protein